MSYIDFVGRDLFDAERRTRGKSAKTDEYTEKLLTLALSWMKWTEESWRQNENASKQRKLALKSFDQAGASRKCVEYISQGADFSRYHATGTCALLCFSQIDSEDGEKASSRMIAWFGSGKAGLASRVGEVECEEHVCVQCKEQFHST
jgi:hypothetical protein